MSAPAPGARHARCSTAPTSAPPPSAGPEKRLKQRRRRRWLEERKQAKHLLKETDRPEVQYLVREDGVWQEQRRGPEELRDWRARQQQRQGRPKYKPSLQGGRRRAVPCACWLLCPERLPAGPPLSAPAPPLPLPPQSWWRCL